jgi:PKD repeat protein
MTSPSPIICHAGGPYSGEIDQPIHFTGTAYGGTPPYTWEWTFGDGGSSTNQNSDHIYKVAGKYNVTLTVTDVNSTVATSTTTATITEPAQEPDIVIHSIAGGFGVKAVIKNIGSGDAMYVPWSINLDGDLIFFGMSKSGIIDIPAHTSVTISNFVFGFGSSNINVTVGTTIKSTIGKVFLFFTRI